MGFRSFVSFGLLAVPVAVTVGILVGLDAYRTSNGMQRIFVDNGIKNTTYCQKAYGIHPTASGQEYTLNPNQWGWNQGDAGHLCMNVTTFNNNTYLTSASAPEFSVTWQYPQGSASQPVHAFPNIMFDGKSKGTLPVKISSLSSLDIDLKWSYGIGDAAVSQTDSGALTAATVNTNVAIDMFLDADSSNSQTTDKAKYEVMVWLAMFGSAVQPIGLADGAKLTASISGVTFSLYSGVNSLGQHVLTWVAAATQEEFSGNIAPLITSLSQVTGVDVPTSSDNLGYLGFGSEAFYSTANVTFAVPRLSMKINKN